MLYRVELCKECAYTKEVFEYAVEVSEDGCDRCYQLAREWVETFKTLPLEARNRVVDLMRGI